MNRINNKGVQYFLEELKPVIYPLYQKFSDGNENMIFSMFLEFYTQFELFPEMISLSQMKTIFFALTESSNNNNNNASINTEYKNSQIQMEKLNFDLFIQALAITAMFFNYKDIVTDLDRLLYLCYSIYYSKDIKKDIFLPIDYVDGFDLEDYKVSHYVGSNPIAVWKQGKFEFSESSLREAMVSSML